MRLTQHIQGYWSVGGQSEPNLINLSSMRNVELSVAISRPEGVTPTFSFGAFSATKNHNREALGTERSELMNALKNN